MLAGRGDVGLLQSGFLGWASGFSRGNLHIPPPPPSPHPTLFPWLRHWLSPPPPSHFYTVDPPLVLIPLAYLKYVNANWMYGVISFPLFLTASSTSLTRERRSMIGPPATNWRERNGRGLKINSINWWQSWFQEVDAQFKWCFLTFPLRRTSQYHSSCSRLIVFSISNMTFSQRSMNEKKMKKNNNTKTHQL